MDNRFQGKACPFCKTTFKEDDVIVVCSVCDMPHHLSCWQENNGCTTFGCTGTIKETVGKVTANNVPTTASQVIAKTTPEDATQKTERPSRRFETLFESEPNTIHENVPVLIEKLSLIIDHQNESLMARCIFRSLTDKPIMAMLVDVKCTDVWGKQAESVEGFQFLDLKTKRESNFGQTEPIPIPDTATRAIEVVIKKVLYSDRTMVDASSDVSVLPKQDTLEAFLGTAELAKEYARESNERAKYVTVEGNHYWRCACGAINRNEDSTCYRCGADKAQLIGLLNVDLISGNLADFEEKKRLKAEREQAEREEQLRQAEERMRLAQEEKERREKEEAERKAEELSRKKAKRKKTAKRISLISVAVLLVSFLVYATGWHIVPYIRYQNACKDLESQLFDEAYDTFVALGTFSDSADKAKDALYQKGVYLMSNGSYLEAASEFDRVSDYQDSSDQAVYCRNEAAYLDAKALLESGSYKEAAEAFTALADYSDSADQANTSNYLYAQELFENGEYENAYTVFKGLSSYKDSKDQANESEYLYGIERFDAGDYEKAVAAFKLVKDYKDVGERLPEAKYQYALVLAEKKEWRSASSLFKELGDYNDSASKYKETYYQYGLQLLSRKMFTGAVKVFNTLGSYQESKNKLNEAKYGYASTHKDSTDTTTYSYLKDLKAAGYKDSKDIYESLYAWSVTAVINDSETDTTTNRTSISKYNTVYCHLVLSGGPPGESITLKGTSLWPNGASKSHRFDSKWHNGYSGCYSCWYNTPANGTTGKLRIRIYNDDTGELLGEFFVTITN